MTVSIHIPNFCIDMEYTLLQCDTSVWMGRVIVHLCLVRNIFMYLESLKRAQITLFWRICELQWEGLKEKRRRRERRCLFWCYICNLLECTHAAFPSSVWDGSYKNRGWGGKKHAETKPVTQAANSFAPSNLLSLFLLYNALQAELNCLYWEKKTLCLIP